MSGAMMSRREPDAPEELLGIGAASAPRAFHADPRHFPKAELTFAEALRRADQILATPEQLFSTEEGRRIIAALRAGIATSSAFEKAVGKGQKVFVLVEQDMAAPPAIRVWATVAEVQGTPLAKVESARAIADEFEQGQLRKWPD